MQADLSTEADSRNIILTRDGKTYKVNLLALYEGGDLRQNVTLQHGDVLNVPDRQFNKIFIFGDTSAATTGSGSAAFPGGSGSTRSRSLYMSNGRMTLVEALSDAGGISQDLSDAARIFVFRGGLGKPKIYHLDAKSPDALLLADRFPLQPRDVIFVDRAEGIRWNQIIDQIQPTVSLLNSIYWNTFPHCYQDNQPAINIFNFKATAIRLSRKDILDADLLAFEQSIRIMQIS